MPAGDNLHRNVIFRNAVAQAYPTTYIETPTPEGLWQRDRVGVPRRRATAATRSRSRTTRT